MFKKHIKKTLFFISCLIAIIYTSWFFTQEKKPDLTPKKDEHLERQTQRALFLAQHPEEKKKTLEGRKQTRY